VTAHAALRPRPGYAALVRAIPVLGRTLEAAALARFCRALSALHGAGVRLDLALDTAAAAADDAHLAAEVAPRAAVVASGRSLADALTGTRSLPSELVSLIATGEHGGDLEAALDRAASGYDERFDVYAKALPAAMFVVGVAVVGLGVLVVALGLVSQISSFYRGL
jgi:type II secretory pathway component PulF